MKIGIDARLWNQTGVGRYIRNLVGEIDRIADSNHPHSYVVYLMPEEYKNVQFTSDRIQKRSVNIRWHSVQEQIKFPQIISKDNLDLMHFTYYSVPYRYKKPYVITLHDVIIYHYYTGKASTLPFPLYHLKHMAYKMLLSQIKKNACKILVPLEATRNDVVALFPTVKSKTIVTREGFDTRISQAHAEGTPFEELSKQKYFLYVGNAYPHKNLSRLLKAFTELDESVKLVLIGKNDYFYKKLKPTLPANVMVLHDVTDAELGYLYKHAVACVSPSLMEGFGLPLLEAMSLSTMVVASDIPAFKEVCKDSALYFNPKNVHSIMSTLMQALNLAPDSKKERISKGKQYASTYSWKEMVQETINAYEMCG